MTDRNYAIVRTDSMGQGWVRAYLCRVGSRECFETGKANPNMIRFTRREDAEYERKARHGAASNVRVEKIA